MSNANNLIWFSFATIWCTIDTKSILITYHLKIIPERCANSSIIWILNGFCKSTIFY